MEGVTMNLRVAILPLCVLWMAGCSEKHKEPDFRNTNWGITSEQVRMLESARLVLDNGKMLSYEGMVAGLPCQIVYIFINNQLVNGHYFFKSPQGDDKAPIQSYDRLKTAVSEKYGTPVLDDAKWKSDTYKGQSDKVGLAIKSGQLSLATEWETSSTEVWLFLTGENSQIKLSMKYVSKLLGGLTEEDKEEELPEPKSTEF